MIDINTHKFKIDGEELTAAEITEKWPDGVKVRSSLDISALGLKEIPFKIKSVGGYFLCRNNQLTSLEGCPENVGEGFHCYNNQLTSLVGCPEYVGESFHCYNNQLTSLKGGPEYVGEGFYCHNNQLTSLMGHPKIVGGVFYCDWLILMHVSDISKYIQRIDNHAILSYYKYIAKKEKHIPVEYTDYLLINNYKKNQKVINNLLKFASGEAIKHFYTK